jgi:hypothetical protein
MSRSKGVDHEVPSTEFFRPLFNVEEANFDTLRNMVAEFAGRSTVEASVESIEYMRGASPALSVITGEEMTRFFERKREFTGADMADTYPTRPQLGFLRDFIIKNTTDVLNEGIEVPAGPLFPFVGRTYTGDAVAAFALGVDERVLVDRRAIQKKVHEYFELPDTDDVMTELWGGEEAFRGMQVARMEGSMDKIIAGLGVIQQVLGERPEVFPETLVAGPIKGAREKGVYRKLPSPSQTARAKRRPRT